MFSCKATNLFLMVVGILIYYYSVIAYGDGKVVEPIQANLVPVIWYVWVIDKVAFVDCVGVRLPVEAVG